MKSHRRLRPGQKLTRSAIGKKRRASRPEVKSSRDLRSVSGGCTARFSRLFSQISHTLLIYNNTGSEHKEEGKNVAPKEAREEEMEYAEGVE